MANKTQEQCAHPGCTCPRAEDSKYCSTYCSAEADHPDIACECGHAECAATRVRTA